MSDVIALIFDFDDTLAPDSTSGFLESLGVDTQQFWTKRVDPLLAQDWDPVPAYLHEMIALSREQTPKPSNHRRPSLSVDNIPPILPTPYPHQSIPPLHAKQYSKLTKTSNNDE